MKGFRVLAGRSPQPAARGYGGILHTGSCPAAMHHGAADSDEAAPLFRDDCAPGFRDDLAP
ncbi:hypothetical protein GOC19_34145, partial [Sinorhizobium meliloti]|nr:hypothetical protein [Sinorhizobium meliloti]